MKRWSLAGVGGLLVLVAVGCRTTQSGGRNELLRDHVLMFDSLGGAHDPVSVERGHYHDLIRPPARKETKRIPDFSEYDAYIGNLIASIKRDKAAKGHVKLLFYFHGGLNSRDAAIDRAARDLKEIHDQQADVYPIFVNWQTSLYASYKDHLLWIRKGQNTYEKGAALWPFMLAADIARAVMEIPVANFLQWKDYARHHTYVPEGAAQAETCGLDVPDFRRGPHRPQTKGQRLGAEARSFVTYLLTKWWAAGVIDSAGSSAWSSMVYTAKRLFYSDQEMHHPYGFTNPSVHGAGALSRFLQRLVSEKVLDDQDEIILVAHSAGAIVANLVVAHFGERLPIRTLVYMAPACTVDELMETGNVSKFLANDERRQLYILALHEKSDLDEKFYLDLAPQGSLLVWLDEFIQPKYAEFGGLMMGRTRTLRLHYHLIPCKVQKQIHVVAYGQSDPKETPFQPQRHGHFGDLQYWLESTWKAENIPGLEKVPFTYDPPSIPPAGQRVKGR